MASALLEYITKNTPPEFFELARANLERIEEELEIFLKMGFTSKELIIQIDMELDPPEVYVTVNY